MWTSSPLRRKKNDLILYKIAWTHIRAFSFLALLDAVMFEIPEIIIF